MLGIYAWLWNRRIAAFKWSFDWTFRNSLSATESFHRGLASDAFANFDIIALSAFRGEYAVGLYGAAHRIVGLGSTSLPATRPHRSPHVAVIRAVKGEIPPD